jgi:dolichol-phosphate mannosyltransferase
MNARGRGFGLTLYPQCGSIRAVSSLGVKAATLVIQQWKPMKLSVILPTYNEERTIQKLLRSVLSVQFPPEFAPVEIEVIVVDDGSSDRTAGLVALEPRAKLLRHERNRGKGAAIRTALGHVTGEVVLIQDADLEYSVEDYPRLLRPFLDERVQVVYGSRFLLRRHPTGMRRMNWLANRILTFTANLLYGAKLTDEATCYKLFRAPLIQSLPLHANGFDFCPEVTALVRKRGVAIHEVPVEYHGRSRAEGKKVRFKHGFEAMKTLVLHRFRRP